MKTQIQTRIGLAVGLTLALLAGLAPRAGAVSANGGTVTNYTDAGGTNWTVHIFTSTVWNVTLNTNLNVTADGKVDVLVVGGGGGGGETIGGGGGGGGVIVTNGFPVVRGSNYAVTVGQGGAGGWGTGYPAGVKGSNSVFASLTAIGGGAGAGYNVAASGTGGSAGGNGGAGGARAGYTSGQGNDGGAGYANNAGGGGGGASQTGAVGTASGGGKGGDGITNSFSGVTNVYAGGGGGGARTGQGVGGAGGTGGGGMGGANGTVGTNGTANTGGGGGGGGYAGEPGTAGGNGGSGIVIVRYIKRPPGAPEIENSTPGGVTTTGATFNGYLVTNGADNAAVFVGWGQTNGAESGAWATTNWWNPGDWTNGSYPATNMTLEADREYFYRFGATNSTTNVMASGSQYLITAGLTPATSDGVCGPTYSETATIGISRPGALTNGALVVNYALSGSGTNYVSASPASGFTLAAGEASRNIVFTPVAWNTGAVATVTLTMLPGAYASNELGSAQVSVTNATTLTAASDTLIGSAMDVIENPPDTVAATVVGTATNYAFFGLSLDLNGKKIYHNTAQRNVVLTNLAGVADSGAGSIDTSWGGATGYIELYSAGPVQIGGGLITRTTSGNSGTGRIRVDGTQVQIGGSVLTHTPGNNANHSGSVTINATGGAIGITNYVATFNNWTEGVWCQAGAVALNAGNITIGGATNGLAIAAYGYGSQNKQGANVTLTATNGVNLATGGIATYGRGGGTVTVTGDSGGAIYIGGNILSYNNNGSYLPGAIAITGANIRVTGNINADQAGWASGANMLAPISIVGRGSVQVDGYVTASRSSAVNILTTGDHSIRIQGSSVTVNGTSSGYSVLAYNAGLQDSADNISLIATNGDITVAGGYDAYSAKSTTYGTVTNIASGNITIGSLNASRFKAITLMAGQGGGNWIYVTGVLTNFTVSETPTKKFTFPTGSVVSNDIYYSVVNNGVGLSGTYSIYVSTTDTGKKLLVGPPGAGGNPPIVANGAATNQTDTTAALVGTMASTGTAASVAYVFWSTTDCTNNEAAWLSTGGGVSNLGGRVQGEVFTNTISGLTASTRYFYNHMGSNSVGKGWAATNASPSFWTDGPPGVGTNTGATAIGAFSATLNGILTNCVSARVFVYYGTDSGNWAYTNDLGWRGTGTFSTAASGLSMNTLCYYQCRATNIYGSALSAVASFTTLAPTTNTMSGDVLIGDPLAGINAAGTAPYTYDFGAYRTLDMGGYKLYRNDQQRDVRVTNVLAILNGGSVDTTRSGAGLTTGYIELYASGAVAFTNNLTTRNQADAATGRILVNATGIRVGGGVTTDNNGWNYTAGSVTLNAPGGAIGITNFVATYCNTSGGDSTYAGGAVSMNATSMVIGGTNSSGYAIDTHGGSVAGAHKGGGSVTLTATDGVTLSTGGMATYGRGGGAVTISDGAGGSAGDIYVGGGLLSCNNEGAYAPGAQTLIGANIRVTGNLDADQPGPNNSVLVPIVVLGSGSVRVDGYITASRTYNSGSMTGDHSVRLQGASVTVGGTNTSGYSVLAMNAGSGAGNYADNISLIATNGDITVAGGYDAYSAYSSASYGTVTNIATGNITIGSLDASRFKSITLIAGQTGTNWIYVTGVLTNFTKSESPKTFTFPAGSVVSNDVYYDVVNNGVGLSGTYDIYVGAVDTLKDLKVGPPGAGGNPPIIVNGVATNQTDTTAGLIGTMASTGTAESVAYLFWSTTDCTNNEAAWLSTGGGVSNLGQRAEGASFTNTVSGLSANTRYYYNHMGSNSVGTAWAATNASPSFWTDGPPGVGTNVGATAIGAFSATLNGALTNGVRARIFVYYGTDYNNWAFTNDLGWRWSGTFSTAAAGLSQNTLCYYQCRATNIYGSALSAVASFTTLAPTTNTMTGDVLIGDPLAGITADGTAPYTYDFGGYLTLNMGGYKLYRNDQQRDVCVTNVLAILNGGSVDTSRSGDNSTGYIEIDATGPVAFTNNLTTRNGANAATGRIRVNATDIRVGGGVLTDNAGGGKAAGAVTLTATAGTVAITNCIATYNHGGGVSVNAGAVALTAPRVTIGGTGAYGHAIDAHGGSAAGQHIGGGAVTIKASSGVTLSTGGISTYGAGGGAVTMSDGAGGSAGDITIGGNVLSYNNEEKSLPGAQTLIGANIRVTGYMDADQKGSGVVSPGLVPIAIQGSGSVRVDGYVTCSRTGDSGVMTGDHSVRIQGASVTVGGTSGGYSVRTYNACVNDAAANISLIATAGDITVAGGYDAWSTNSARGTVTNIASGKIVIGSLDAARFKAITLQAGAGQYDGIQVTGVITNFTTNASPKRITFPSGSVISNDIYYNAASNTTTGLSGDYEIWVASDTGKRLRDRQPPWETQGSVFRFR